MIIVLHILAFLFQFNSSNFRCFYWIIYKTSYRSSYFNLILRQLITKFFILQGNSFILNPILMKTCEYNGLFVKQFIYFSKNLLQYNWNQIFIIFCFVQYNLFLSFSLSRTKLHLRNGNRIDILRDDFTPIDIF